VACVGPAGENEVVYATIASDGGDHHAGRGGAGAVMGAKQLKAVVAAGERPSGLEDLRSEYEQRFAEEETGSWHTTRETVESVDFANEVGVLSTRGWQESTFEATDEIGIEAVEAASREREHDGDPIPGGFRIQVNGKETTPRGATQMTLGAGLGIDEFEDVAVLGELCNRLGVDIIGVGNAVAWTFRAAEAGLIDHPGSFGDVEAAEDLIEAIASREAGLPEDLADGLATAAERHGGADLIPTVKGMELPSYDPRRAPGMALAYATSDRGACHRRARPIDTEVFDPALDEPRRRAREVATEQDFRSLLWSLIADDFAGEVFSRDFGAEYLGAAGLDRSRAELRTAGERIWNLTRLFNVREGFARQEDELPAILAEPVADGPGAGTAVDEAEFSAMLEAYYAERGWDSRGIPTRETLSRLDLDGLAPADLRREDTRAQ
jgi:aldehyde:ferredoxin oxidoreductase